MFRRLLRFSLFAAALGISGGLGLVAGVATAVGLLIFFRFLSSAGLDVPAVVEASAVNSALIVGMFAGIGIGAWLLRTRPDELPP